MSKLLAEAYDVTVTSFAGGKDRGPCVQIDAGQNGQNNVSYVQLTREQAEFTRDVLSKWLKGDI